MTLRTRAAIVTILAVCALALGTAGAAWAREPVMADEGQCGAQGDQKTEQNDDKSCGADMNGQSGDQGEKQDGQNGTDEQGEKQAGQNGDQGAMQSGQSGANQTGTQQNGEFEGEN
jgi:hypothetical protein